MGDYEWNWPIELAGGPRCGEQFSLREPVELLHLQGQTGGAILSWHDAYRRTDRKTADGRQIFEFDGPRWILKSDQAGGPW